MKRLFLPALLLVLGSIPAHAQDARSAEAFLRAVYANQAKPESGRAFWDVQATNRIVTPSLLALRQRDLAAEQAAHEPSDLDFGPLCGCQDDTGLHVVGVAVRMLRPGHASASVTLGFGTLGFGDAPAVVRMDLVAVGPDWRIDDIRGGPEHGKSVERWDLRTILRHSIAGNTKTTH